MAREYGRIYTAFWVSPGIRKLSDQGKLLAGYLLSGPHTNMIGAYLLPDAYVADDLGWSGETVRQTLSELFQNGFAERFKDGRHIVICKFLEWNPIENPNIGKAALKMADALPDDPALSHVLNGLKLYEKQFPNGFGTLSERLCKPFRNMEMEMEREIEPEREIDLSSSLRSAPQPATIIETVSRETKPKFDLVDDLPAHMRRTPAKAVTKIEPDTFPAFYAAYPLHKARPAAAKAYAAALKRASPDVLLAGAQRYAAARATEDPKFTKHPATWLNQDCWLDEEPKNVIRTKPASSHDRFNAGVGLYLESLGDDADEGGEGQGSGDAGPACLPLLAS